MAPTTRSPVIQCGPARKTSYHVTNETARLVGPELSPVQPGGSKFCLGASAHALGSVAAPKAMPVWKHF
jgi:hypothetical protein